VNSIFRFPRLQDFALLLHPQNEVEISWKSVVPIKPNGSKIPLFLIHGAGANITPFYGLAEHLDGEQPVYGIQSKGLDGVEAPLETIEEMAAYYLEEIRKVYPKGPFHVGGQSFGAYVAFEMAKQMKSKGESIGRVFLFDVSAYQSDTKMDTWGKFKLKVSARIGEACR
jgi:thioesterase domain-containing protein